MSIRRSLNFDQIADRYDETRGGEERGRQFAPDLARLLRPDKRVLDVGLGTGAVAAALCELGFDVLGLDLSERMLARARPRLRGGLVRGDVMSLPFAADSIDQAYSVWVLHVVGDVSVALRELARVMRPGGRYLVMDERIVWEEAETDPVAMSWYEIAEGLGLPARVGQIEQYARLAMASGLQVVEVVPVGPYSYQQSPNEAAQKIETRAQSALWSVDEDRWQRVVVPVINRLRAMPHAEQPILHHYYQEILVLER